MMPSSLERSTVSACVFEIKRIAVFPSTNSNGMSGTLRILLDPQNEPMIHYEPDPSQVIPGHPLPDPPSGVAFLRSYWQQREGKKQRKPSKIGRSTSENRFPRFPFPDHSRIRSPSPSASPSPSPLSQSPSPTPSALSSYFSSPPKIITTPLVVSTEQPTTHRKRGGRWWWPQRRMSLPSSPPNKPRITPSQENEAASNSPDASHSLTESDHKESLDETLQEQPGCGEDNDWYMVTEQKIPDFCIHVSDIFSLNRMSGLPICASKLVVSQCEGETLPDLYFLDENESEFIRKLHIFSALRPSEHNPDFYFACKPAAPPDRSSSADNLRAKLGTSPDTALQLSLSLSSSHPVIKQSSQRVKKMMLCMTRNVYANVDRMTKPCTPDLISLLNSDVSDLSPPLEEDPASKRRSMIAGTTTPMADESHLSRTRSSKSLKPPTQHFSHHQHFLKDKETPFFSELFSLDSDISRDSNGDDPLDKISVRRWPEIEKAEWDSFFNQEGQLCVRKQHVLDRIFSCGVEHSVRPVAWKFLLQVYPWESTKKEREEIEKVLSKEYWIYKNQWKSMTTEQLKRFKEMRETMTRIKKDVIRTDRTHSFFKRASSSSLVVLNDVLVTYCMYNFDLGYCQGMNDLLSPIVYVMDGDEPSCFWCFKGFMDRAQLNFEKSQTHIEHQLSLLNTLLSSVDPVLKRYLDDIGGESMFFCFRWLLCYFKREYNYVETMRLWEVLWTDCLTPNFELFFALATLLSIRRVILVQRLRFDEILKICNELSGKMDVNEILVIAEFSYQYWDTVRHSCPPLL